MRAHRRWTTVAVALGGATIAIAVLAATGSPATAHDELPRRDLAAVRAATARYHELDAAIDDGYELLDVCFESPSGGMGYHYIKGVDANLDPLAPEALVYEPTDQGPKLVAVEYIVPTDLASSAPSLLGHDLHRHSTLPLWILHAWVWQPNPAGMFADFNPNVVGCPA